MHRVRACILAALVVLGCLGAAGPARAGFLPDPVPIDDGAGAGRVVAASLAVLPSGASLAAWTQEACGATDLACLHAACPTSDAACLAETDPTKIPNPVRAWASALTNGAWTPPQPLAVGTGDASRPTAALASAGNGVVVFLQGDGTHTALWAARLAGGAFAPTERIDGGTAGQNVTGAAVAADAGGRYTAAWSQYRAGRIRVLARRYQGAWGAPAAIDTGGGAGSAGTPSVAARDGAALVAWPQGAAGGATHVYAARFDGSAWAAPAAVDGAATGSAQSTIVGLTSAGQGVIAFAQAAPTVGLYAARMQAGGFLDAERMDVGAGTDHVGNYALSVDPASGAALVAWSQRSGTRRKIWARRLAAGAWGLPACLDDAVTGGDADSPSVALRSAGDGLAAWYAFDVASQRFHVMASSLVGGVWGAPSDLGVATGPPIVGTTDTGDAIGLWFFNDGTRDRLGATPDDATPPSVELDPVLGQSGKPVALAARVLGDALSGVETVRWTFGDGTAPSSAVAPSHTWTLPGRYVVTLTATDRAGNQASATTSATIDDGTPPAVDAGPARTAYTGLPLTLSGTATDEVALDPSSIRWSQVGTARTWAGLEIEVTFDTPGTVTMRLTAKDAAGNTGTDDVVVTVRDRGTDRTPPVVDAGPDQTVPLGAPVTLAGTAVDAGAGVDDATVGWTVDDGATYSGLGAVHRFTTRGDHVATLSATDLSGNEGHDQVVVHVGPDTAPPEITLGDPVTVEVGAPVPLHAAVRDDGSGVDPATERWTLPGPHESPGLDAIATFAYPGRYVATFHVSDMLGNAGTADLVILVTPVGGDHDGPTVSAGPDVHAWVGVPVDLVGLADDGGGVGVDPGSARWVAVQGGAVVARGLETTTKFTSEGQRTLTLHVADWLGQEGTDDAVVQVDRDTTRPTIRTAARVEVAPGHEVRLEATAEDGQSGIEPGSVRWSFDDGTTTDGLVATRTWTEEGSHIARLDVEDLAGNAASAEVLVQVGISSTADGPRVSVRPSLAVFARDRVAIRVDARPGAAPLARVEWRVGTKWVQGVTLRLRFRAAGSVALMVRATDTQGKVGRGSVKVSVRRLAVAIASARRTRRGVVVRVRANGAGVARVTVRVGRKAVRSRSVRVGQGRAVDIRLPHASLRLHGRAVVAVALARSAGARAAATRRVVLR